MKTCSGMLFRKVGAGMVIAICALNPLSTIILKDLKLTTSQIYKSDKVCFFVSYMTLCLYSGVFGKRRMTFVREARSSSRHISSHHNDKIYNSTFSIKVKHFIFDLMVILLPSLYDDFVLVLSLSPICAKPRLFSVFGSN